MGFFNKLFSGSQPKSKYDIIKRFAKERMKKLQIDEIKPIEFWDIMELEGLPESTIITISDSYFHGKNEEVDDFTIFQHIEEHRNSYDSFPNPEPLPTNLNLKNYIYYRLKFELPNDNGMNIGENGFTRDFIERVIDETTKLYLENF